MKKFFSLRSTLLLLVVFIVPEVMATVNIGRMALVLCHTPAILLDRKNILEQSGITDYNLTFFTKGSKSALALGAGETDMAFFGAIIPAIANGLDARIVAVNSSSGVQLVCNNDNIKTLADLKGKKIGSIGPTSAPTSIFSMALNEAGLSLNDIEYNHINRRNIVLAMTEKDVVDCAVLVEPLTSEALKRGAHLTLDEKQLYNNGDYPFTFVVAKKSFIESNPESVQKVIDAHISTQDYINNNIDETIDIVHNYFNENGVAATKSELKQGSVTNTFNPKINQAVMENLIDSLVASGVLEKKVAFNDLVDCSFGQCD